MRLTRASFVFLLIVILFSSFVPLFYFHRCGNFSALVPTTPHDALIIRAPFVFGVTLLDKPPPLNQSTRTEIYNFVKANPGFQFRGICESLNLSIGVAQYHLGLLTKAGLISFFRDGRYKRYFKSNKFKKRELVLISLIRRRTTGQIVKILLENKQVSHSDLSFRLSMSSQALTWQMNRLKKEGIVQETREGKRSIYFLDEADTPILKQYISLIGNNKRLC